MRMGKDSTIDDIVYVIACFLTLGAVWLTRIIITQAIKAALED